MAENLLLAEKSKQKILVVGGAGYIGGYLTDMLEKNGYEVAVYDNLTYEDRFLKDVRFVHGDVRDEKKLGAIINHYPVVVWLAAIVGDGACAVDTERTTRINVDTVAWLARNYTGKVIFMSTCSVYGLNNLLIDETAAVNPLSHYARTKVEAEEIITKNIKDYLIFRLGTLFGLGDRFSRIRLDLVVNILTKRAVFGEPLVVNGGGQWRPLLHVKDVARAILFGIEREVTGLYNVSEKNYMIHQIADAIAAILPQQVTVSYVNAKFEDLRNYRVVSDKFKAFGWEPRYDLAFGVNELYRALSEGRIKWPNDRIYSNADYIKEKII